MTTPIVEMNGIGKRYGGVVALNNVQLQVFPGEVLAVIGENGAGKSTLMKVLSGVIRPDEGNVRVGGESVVFSSPLDAIRAGIALIPQELNLADNLNIGENVFLGREPRWGGPLGMVDRKKMHAETQVYLDRLGLRLSSKDAVRGLSLARQRMVEIAKALSLNARILIMDEPTASLTLQETDRLLEIVRQLRVQGVSVLYISHRLKEIEAIADRAVSLRDGKNAGELNTGEIHRDAMVRLMVGRQLEELAAVPQKKSAGPAILEIRELRTRRYPEATVSLSVSQGEILGVGGLEGAGRTELARAIFGIEPALQGAILMNGRDVVIRSPKDAISAGIYLVPEDRRDLGLITRAAIRENITLPSLSGYTRMGMVDAGRESAAAKSLCEKHAIKIASVEEPVSNLSGGNQQKVVLAKWTCMSPKAMIFDEPTRGIDIGAKVEIYRLMRRMADSGVAVLMISSDLEELFVAADRVAVMRNGAITGFLDRSQFSEEAIMGLAVH